MYTKAQKDVLKPLFRAPGKLAESWASLCFFFSVPTTQFRLRAEQAERHSSKTKDSPHGEGESCRLWRELKHLSWDRFPSSPEPVLFCVPTGKVQISTSEPDKRGVCCCGCICVYSCLHTRPGGALLQFAPLGTAMRLVCKGWRQAAALVCGITQPLLPSAAL